VAPPTEGRRKGVGDEDLRGRAAVNTNEEAEKELGNERRTRGTAGSPGNRGCSRKRRRRMDGVEFLARVRQTERGISDFSIDWGSTGSIPSTEMLRVTGRSSRA
jgi:hypothetical protein